MASWLSKAWNFCGKTVKVLFQNENIVAHETANGNTDATKENVIATTPDVIAGIITMLCDWILENHSKSPNYK